MKVGNRDINAFISPDLNAGVADKMSKGEQAKKILSNFGQQVSVKVNRIMHKIETLFAGGEWVDNKAVMKKLTSNIGELKSKLNDVKTTSFADTARIRQELKEMRGICDLLSKGVKDTKLKPLTDELEGVIKETVSKDEAIGQEDLKTVRRAFERQSTLESTKQSLRDTKFPTKFPAEVNPKHVGKAHEDVTAKPTPRKEFEVRAKTAESGEKLRSEFQAEKDKAKHKVGTEKRKEADTAKHAERVEEQTSEVRTIEEEKAVFINALKDLLQLANEDKKFKEVLGRWRGENSSDNQVLKKFIETGETANVRKIFEIMQKGLVATGKAKYINGNSGDITVLDESSQLWKVHDAAVKACNVAINACNTAINTYNAAVKAYNAAVKDYEATFEFR